MNSKYGTGLAALGGFLVLAAGIACGSEPESAAPGTSAPITEQPTATPGEIETAVVTGTVAYFQRLALSPDASVVIKLLDASRADAPSITLSEQVIDNPGQAPIAFELPYVPAEIDARFTYVVRAEIFEGDELVFTTAVSYPVITGDNPTEVDLVLEPVPGAPSTGDESAVAELFCASTMAVQLPIEFAQAGDPISTGFDGINAANCTFPERIAAVRVTITNAETGATHTQVFSLSEASEQVGFPLGEDVLSMGTAEVLAPGEYERKLWAVAVDGNVYDLTQSHGALGTVTVLAAETEDPTAPVAPPVAQKLICMLTRAAQLPIEFTHAGDAISTAFDGINVANCTFPGAIESVRVTITNNETGAKHTQLFSLPEPSDRVSFPLGEDVLSLGTAEIVAPGEYGRVLEAVAVDGEVYDLTADQSALKSVTVLPAEAVDPGVQDVMCVTTLAVQLPIEITQAGDPISTGFDGINVASCTFPVAIETVKVTITHAVSGAMHTQVFSLPEPADRVSFPLGDDVLSFGTLEVLESGEYERVLEAVSVDGEVYDLTADQGALGAVTVISLDAS